MADLIVEATKRAAILHASAAWGSDADGNLMDRLLDHIEELQAHPDARDWQNRAERAEAERKELRERLAHVAWRLAQIERSIMLLRGGVDNGQ